MGLNGPFFHLIISKTERRLWRKKQTFIFLIWLRFIISSLLIHLLRGLRRKYFDYDVRYFIISRQLYFLLSWPLTSSLDMKITSGFGSPSPTFPRLGLIVLVETSIEFQLNLLSKSMHRNTQFDNQ